MYYAEVLTPRNDGPSYEDIAVDAVEAKLFSIQVRAASVRGLLRLKENALTSSHLDASKHQEDIGLLRKYAF